ncbi:MAG TPA: hypothetical protein VJ965_03430 [Anaerolineales bacterium]|nr:hypothetical protein [Anaerolineales bacterium]
MFESKKKKDPADSPASGTRAARQPAQAVFCSQGEGGMMGDELFDQITRFMEQVEDHLPENVSNGMILLALREERESRRRETKMLMAQSEMLIEMLKGRKPDGSDGLLYQVAAFDRFRRGIVWAFSAMVLAFLGGVGMWVFSLVVE